MTRGSSIAGRALAAACLMAAALVPASAQAAPPQFAFEPAQPRPGQEITFRATSRCSFCTWVWRTDDGASRTDRGSVSPFRHRFTTAGPHTVSLSTREPFGRDETTTVSVTVVNGAPVAAITLSPSAPSPGQDVTFIDASTDPDGDPMTRMWDTDGDGFDDGTAASVTLPAGHVAGRTVRLQVTDIYGAVTVAAAPQIGAAGVTPRLRPVPRVRFVGRVTPRGARLRVVSVTAPAGARIDARCVGKGCPRRIVPRTLKRADTVRLRVLERALRSGTRVRIRVTVTGTIGKFAELRVRRRASPARRDLCVRTPTSAPARCN